MAQTKTLTSAEVLVYLNGNLFPELQSINYSISRGEEEYFGIDSIFAQEIRATKITISGSISGVISKGVGGLAGKSAVTTLFQALEAPYVSIKIKNRYTDSDLIFIPHVKFDNEQVGIAIKGVVKFSVNFKGIIAYNELDLLYGPSVWF